MYCHSYSQGFIYKNIIGETQLLDHNALAICTYILTNKRDNYFWDLHYWYCCYGNKVIYNTCNMCIDDLPDMYALSPRACGSWASGIHIRHILHAHFTTIYMHTGKYTYVYIHV